MWSRQRRGLVFKESGFVWYPANGQVSDANCIELHGVYLGRALIEWMPAGPLDNVFSRPAQLERMTIT
jgi:hypothetical protein